MIYLYGNLRKKFGKVIGAKVHSVQELVRAAEANRPGFRCAIEGGRDYIVRRGKDFRKGKDVDTAEVEMRFGEDTWHVVPLPAGHSAAARIMAGAVLIAAGFFTYGTTWAYAGAVGAGMMGAGAGLVLGGVVSLLTPLPEMPSADGEGDPSYLFDGPTNKSGAGGAVPLIFGETWVGSTFLSGGLDVGEIVE